VLVDHGVPHPARIAVAGVIRADDVAFEARAQLIGNAHSQLLVDIWASDGGAASR
jgi:hypothetical protein